MVDNLASFPPVRGLMFSAAPLVEAPCPGPRRRVSILLETSTRRPHVPRPSDRDARLVFSSFYARCASCHDFDVAFPGRLRRAAVGVLGYSAARAPLGYVYVRLGVVNMALHPPSPLSERKYGQETRGSRSLDLHLSALSDHYHMRIVVDRVMHPMLHRLLSNKRTLCEVDSDERVSEEDVIGQENITQHSGRIMS